MLSLTGTLSSAQSDNEIKKHLEGLPFAMPEMGIPVFPDRLVSIVDFGAVGDGQTMNTDAINKAIGECAAKGGGTVLIPAGLWLTGPISLQSNINLHAEKGAIILFSRNHADYPVIKNPVKGSFEVASPISGYGLENIAITGGGIFDGSGDTWRPVKKDKTTEGQWKELLASGGVVDKTGLYWPTRAAMEGPQYLETLKKKDKKTITAKDYEPARDYLRPYMVMLYKCNNVLLDGPTFQNSPKFVLYPSYCQDMVIRNINVLNEWWAQNGDGIDISGGKNILIYNCMVNAGDDGICMKSSVSERYSETPALQDVVISDCVVYHAHGGFVIGSNTDGGMSNISVSNCNFISTDVGLRFKSSRGRGGVVQNIFISNIYMKDIAREAILFDTYYEYKAPSDSAIVYKADATTPVFRDFSIKNVFCNGARQAVSITGLPEMPIQYINFENMIISAKLGFTSLEASNIHLANVTILNEKGIPFTVENSRDMVFKGIKIPDSATSFMKLSGEFTGNIQVEGTDLSKVKNAFEFGAGVSPDAVKVK